MIREILTPAKDILAFEAVGKVSTEDYLKQIEPPLDKARAEGRKVRFLFQFGKDFESFTPGAAWEDFKVGVLRINTISSCAVVSDIGWIRSMSKLWGTILPCSVKVYKNSERDDALAWLNSGEIGLEHHLDDEKKVLTVEINAPLSAHKFEVLSSMVDPWIEKHGNLNGLVIHAKEFPGWENLGSLFRHIEFVKNHHRKVRHVALAVDGKLAELAPELAKHFVEAKIKHFGFNELPMAQKWAADVTT